MAKRSAGLLIYRRSDGDIQVLLVHPGGPFWARKDEGAWSIPKGLIDEDEDELKAAQREAGEELGITVDGSFARLGDYKQPGGKIVIAWSVEASTEIDVAAIKSNSFTMEWPPRSGSMKEFPEVDRAGWFSLPEAAPKILQGQRPMLSDLAKRLGTG
ncbi:NUDIX domain-containing protein [Mesorhizobium sp. WSM4307]|uniref:NUDIX domain-containing protein n=1 Tax=unclassified Mesorhizobium TaxID=325217 RepID=UPI00115EBC4F|nr:MULTISPECIES: NUDIX domain-containing protein [unclassified Mesorhizobium]TRC72844.1 NUDIX domain-containing protein [Mesorhizobium sp. WSM4315]TRC75843.1 NUDIX domain-containing protein [Mesorhizobium sp. WSM4307]